MLNCSDLVAKRNRAKRKRCLAACAAAGLGIFVSFQNFESLTLSQLRPEISTAQAAKQSSPSSVQAPDRVMAEPSQYIAVPQSGSDLSSVQSDWLKRQAKMITKEAEKQVVDELNQAIDGFLGTEDVPPTRGIASVPTADRAPASVRLRSLNQVQVSLYDVTKLNCSFNGDSVNLSLTHPVANDLGLDLTHHTADSRSEVRLRYTW